MNIIKKITDSKYVVVHNHLQVAVIIKEKYSLGWVLRVYKVEDVYYHDGTPKEGTEAIFEAPSAKFEAQLAIYFSLINYHKS